MPKKQLIRNGLSSYMIPVLNAIFQDMTDDAHTDLSRQNATSTRPIYSFTADDFIIAIKDLPPEYIRRRHSR